MEEGLSASVGTINHLALISSVLVHTDMLD